MCGKFLIPHKNPHLAVCHFHRDIKPIIMRSDHSYSLSSDQVESFEKDGFLIIEDMFDPATIEQITRWTAEVKAWPSRPGQHMPYEEERADGTIGLCRTESELAS